MSANTILWEVEEGIGTLILNRPEKLNALNDQMADELFGALVKAKEDESIKVIIITGAGRAFCAGADIKERFLPRMEKKKRGELWGEAILGYAEKCCLFLTSMAKPVIAALNGTALGFGSTLALACDIRIASEELKMGFGFLRMGVTPEFGSSYFLPRLIGIARACELVFTGRTIDALEAKEIGLVNQVVSTAALMKTVRELAQSIASAPPISTQLAKQLLYQGLNSDLRMQLRMENYALETSRSTRDHEEAVKAFLEKRRPVFIGK
jgi:2-(1,2-epoxy-1,2-dihydrophenyl)acetyl-CoA isomerase